MDCLGGLSDVSFDELQDIKKSMIDSMGMAQRIYIDLENNGDMDNANLMRDITACCFRVLGSIRNSEELAKLDKYEAVKVNMSEFLEELTAACNMRLRRLNIKLGFECDEDIFVSVDADRLTACMMNLIINSIQNDDSYDPSRDIKIKVKKLGESVSVTVSDDGYGMDNEKLRKILDDDDHKGGLAVVKKFCEKAGTQIIADTSVDGGLIISFRLPLAEDNDLAFHSKRLIVQTGTFSTVNVLLTKVKDAVVIF